MDYEVVIEEPTPFCDTYDNLEYAEYALNGLYEGRDINKPFFGKILVFENSHDIKPIGMKLLIG